MGLMSLANSCQEILCLLMRSDLKSLHYMDTLHSNTLDSPVLASTLHDRLIVISYFQPDIVVLIIGTNDIYDSVCSINSVANTVQDMGGRSKTPTLVLSERMKWYQTAELACGVSKGFGRFLPKKETLQQTVATFPAGDNTSCIKTSEH
ncbi:hypothetical protein DPMN_161237 [Dreissena polymorpha]|uniref:Uncharacterized protein n=1 Tax=Dreissena polymorpha TaxID=45954 RepID=A0A9D4ESS0_DREPO|nr:hypothetical protein DPMN_161237 [Dreissena polymorpha]